MVAEHVSASEKEKKSSTDLGEKDINVEKVVLLPESAERKFGQSEMTQRRSAVSRSSTESQWIEYRVAFASNVFVAKREGLSDAELAEVYG